MVACGASGNTYFVTNTLDAGAGSLRDAITSANATPAANRFEGNYLGTDAKGTNARPNGLDGIWVDGGGWNIIGGTNALSRNILSGNSVTGIYLERSTNDFILGNYFGLTNSSNRRSPCQRM